jgi:sigma-E factor negative regulatory protein RseC
MPYMINTGRIVKIRGKEVDILPSLCLESGACFGCMAEECKRRPHLITALNSPGLPLAIGQVVETEAADSPLGIQLAQALLPPPLGFIAGFFLTRLVFPSSGEAARAFAGMACMILACALFYLYRRFKPAKTQARITRLI